MAKKLICKNCSLYNKEEGVCKVVVVNEGEKYEVRTKPNDPCVWIENGIEVQGIRMWSDGKNGYIEETTDYDKESEYS